ncbi:MAG: CehA/McbA family metallohydrolase [Verrucomicrobiota bacterium]
MHTKHLLTLGLGILLGFNAAPSSLRAAEAFEVGPDDVAKLPKGKEADGIIGDFVLRNDKVEAVISHNALYRRANMSTFYGETGITPGCLYDLTLRGENNDQLVIFTPSQQQGMVSYVRVANNGKGGEAAVETVVTAANNKGLYKRHEYRLRDGWQGVLIVTTFRNESTQVVKGTPDDRWTKFARSGTERGISWADAEDPADKAGYSYAWVEPDGLKIPAKEVELKPGQEISFARFLAVGRSPLEAMGVVMAQKGPVGTLSGTIKDAAGKPISIAKVEVVVDGKPIVAYPDDQGAYRVSLRPGDYEVSATGIGRDVVKGKVKVEAKAIAAFDPVLSAESSFTFDIQDETGKSVPCKAQFLGVNGTKNPELGPQNRAYGCVDQYHSEKGQFTVAVPPGEYKVVVTHGVEFSHLSQTVKLEAGKKHTVKGVLKRLVDTKGWISADFHNHSTPSGDNTTGTDDRIINLAAEHIEFAPTTEHNRLYDWRPHIEKLGLRYELQTVSGMELTGSGAHFNMFPLTPKWNQQDNGAPQWNPDPRITAVTLRDFQGQNPHRWVQINHPDMVANFIDRDADGRVDGGFLGLERLIDGVETQNYADAQILNGSPFRLGRDRAGKESVTYLREFIWLQLLNRGHRYWATAVCDAHTVYGNGVGGWRMYFPSASDKPNEIEHEEIARHAKAGRSYLTTGPFLQVTTEDGIQPGGETRATGSIKLKVKVQCTDWIDIDRVQVLVNGRQEPKLNFTRKSHPKMFADGVVKFDQTLEVGLSEDSHLIVVAMGENSDLSTGYGTSSQAKIRPCAYHNPIFVDADGGGFKPNGDLLGWPLPTKGMKVEEVRALLERK